jgi:protein-tyrosine phosphatase
MAELDISSAGTRARDGEPMDGYAAAEAKRLGAKGAEHHLTRRIRAAHVEQADLVIGMAREHRAAATSIVPSANRRAFTLVEFARILDALMTREIEGGVAPIGPDGFAAFLQRVVSAAYIARGLVLATRNPDDLDIVDPYRRDPGVYRESADAVDALTRRVATAIRALAS